MSEPFPIKRGIRQWFPLSPLLFVLTVEIPAIKSKSLFFFKGGRGGGENTGTCQKCSTSNPTTSDHKGPIICWWHHTMSQRQRRPRCSSNKIQSVRKHIRLEVEHKKTEAMCLGRDKNNRAEHENLKWVRQIRTLGVQFRSDTSEHDIEDNWSDKTEEKNSYILIHIPDAIHRKHQKKFTA